MVTFANRVQVTTATTGTGTITLGSPVLGYQGFTAGGITNGASVRYTIEDSGSWEVGTGVYDSGAGTLTRSPEESSNAGSAISLSGSAIVFVTVAAADVLNKAGDTMTGALVLPADPTSNLEAATKQYVDTIAAAGIHYHAPVRVETPSSEGSLNATYDNGTAGVGATLTNAGAQAALVIDGVTLNSADRVLVYNQSDATQNGVYTVTDTGSGSTNWVLTRSTDTDSYSPSSPDALGQGDGFFVLEGNTGAGELYVCNTVGTITFGTTEIMFTQVAATAVYTAGTNLQLSGTQFSTIASPTFTNITANGNIIVTGLVDGRDIATNIPASLGVAGQVLTVNAGATAAEWANASGGTSYGFVYFMRG